MKITGLFRGNIEEEVESGLGLLGEEEGGGGHEERERVETCRLVSAVGRPTAAVDVELTGPGSHTH